MYQIHRIVLKRRRNLFCGLCIPSTLRNICAAHLLMLFGKFWTLRAHCSCPEHPTESGSKESPLSDFIDLKRTRRNLVKEHETSADGTGGAHQVHERVQTERKQRIPSGNRLESLRPVFWWPPMSALSIAVEGAAPRQWQSPKAPSPGSSKTAHHGLWQLPQVVARLDTTETFK